MKPRACKTVTGSASLGAGCLQLQAQPRSDGVSGINWGSVNAKAPPLVEGTLYRYGASISYAPKNPSSYNTDLYPCSVAQRIAASVLAGTLGW